MKDQPASTAPLAAGLPLVQGRCPACGTKGLFLGDGGYITCSLIDCPNPSAADDLLHGDQATKTRVAALCEQWVKAGPPLGVSMARWWDARLIELRGAIHAPAAASCSPTAAETEPNNPAATEATEPHIYLSTGCYHNDHAYCQAMTGLAGAKRPASCKFCHAACQCPCHEQTEPPVHVGGGANAEDCPACRPEIDKTVLYPWTCPGPDKAAADEDADPDGAWTPDPPIGCLNLSQPKED